MKEKKKICFFMGSPFSLGGEQRVTTIIANNLIKNGFEICFATTDEVKNDYKKYNMNEKIKVYKIDNFYTVVNKLIGKMYRLLRKINDKTGIFKHNLYILKKFYLTSNQKKQLINFFGKNKFDYIIGVGSDYYTRLNIIEDKINQKIISWQHNSYEAYFRTYGRRFYNQDALVDYVFEKSDKYIVLTDDSRNKILKNLNYSTIVLNNPNSFSNTNQISLKNKFFVSAGRFEYVKNFKGLLNSFIIFANKNKDWKLFIYGEGKEKYECEQMIKKYNLQDRIFLPGTTDNMESVYQQGTIYLLSSLWEGWPMVITEAMSYGLPIISYDHPFIHEMFGDYKCGLTARKFDETEFAEKMLELVNDEVLMKKISDNEIKQIKKFDIKIIIKKWIKLLEE